ncbi:MAG: cytochrome P450 [Gammaproteobacteria bacterium]|nr:cytochrome P450 [Gammaproteobacteria bacterium]
MFEFNPYSPEIDADPFPAYHRLLEEFPCFWSEHAKMWVLSRFEDVARALDDWETYSSSHGNLMDEIPGRAGATLGSLDPPRHDRLRTLVQSVFTPKTVQGMIPPSVKVATECLDRCLEKGQFDFVDDFSSRITVSVLFDLMGLPPTDHRAVRQQVILAISTNAELRRKGPENIAGFQYLVQYIQDQVAQRRSRPAGTDLISGLVAAEIDGDKLSEQEIVMTSATLIMAGVESLSSFMTMFALNLHDFPFERRKIIANPALMAPAIEESLRFNTSAQRFRRYLMRDVELHGQRMKAGDFVCMCYGAANRDPRQFPNPDVYDVDRPPKRHLGFGGGKHLCLGTAVGRQVTAAVMAEFLKRIPDYQRTTPILKWNSSTTFRSPSGLPIAVA